MSIHYEGVLCLVMSWSLKPGGQSKSLMLVFQNQKSNLSKLRPTVYGMLGTPNALRGNGKMPIRMKRSALQAIMAVERAAIANAVLKLFRKGKKKKPILRNKADREELQLDIVQFEPR